jgi:hypothetical protein
LVKNENLEKLYAKENEHKQPENRATRRARRDKPKSKPVILF